mgnify:FL=1
MCIRDRLRCVKYATEYLRAHGNDCLHRDYTLLKLKNDHRRIIPAYSEEEISGIAQAADTASTIGKRNLAIILVAYCTGLRGIDIIGIKLSDIDWHNHKVSVVQSKTHTPIVSELNGATLNALADYILDWRPKCDIPEVFVTVKAPYSVSKTVKGIWQKDSRVRPQCGQFTVNLRKIVRFYSDYILWFTAKMQD